MERKTGARGLRTVFEKILGDVMYTAPSDYTIEKIIVTEDCVKNGEAPLVKTNENREPVELHSSDLKNAK